MQEQSIKFLEVERRYNYATPKRYPILKNCIDTYFTFDLLTYLEFINMYKRLLIIKATELDQQIARLQTGNLYL